MPSSASRPESPAPLALARPAAAGGRGALLAALALGALAALSWLPRLDGPIDLRWDGAAYYVLGTALAEGRGYRLLNEPGEIEAVQYPPLLPLVIAAHQRLLGTTDFVVVGRALRLTFAAISVVFAVATFLFLARHLPPRAAVVGALLCLLNFFAGFMSDLCFAEIPFALVTLLFVLAEGPPAGPRARAAAPLLAAGAYLLRTAGIALLAAWVLESAWRRNARQTLLRLAVALVPVVGWSAYVAGVESSAAYRHPAYPYQRADYLFYNVSYARNLSLKDPFQPELGRVGLRDLAARLAANLARVPPSLAQTVSVKREDWRWQLNRVQRVVGPIAPWRWVAVILGLVGGLVVGGLLLQLGRGPRLVALYVLFTVLLVAVTPWPAQWVRYYTPLAPFLVLALFQGLAAARGAAHAGLPRLAPAVGGAGRAVVALILAVQVVGVARLFSYRHQEVTHLDLRGRPVSYRLFFYGPAYRALDGAIDWLRARAGPTDVVAASLPHWVYLRTGLKAVMPPFEPDARTALALLDAVPVRYLLVGDAGADYVRHYTLPAVQQAPGRWKLVYSAPDGRLDIYERAS